ncbi:MAG: hypothetical protein H6720_21005 [Sandaracinus sp.]|nr:hypothetical protein [Sandaracinus sp.]MCB9622717.1 hypothetical protein [Sandaracinus sp.]
MDATAEELIARLRRDPEDFEAFRLLGEHYRRLGDHASLANLLEGWAKRSQDGAKAARAYHESALLVMELGDLPRAESLLLRSLERDATFADADAQLVALLEHRGDTTALLQHLTDRAARLNELGDRAGLAAVEEQIGRTYEHRLGRPDRAIAHYRKAFEADPSLVPAIYAAREIYRAAGNPKAAATLFELEVKAEPTRERRVALLRELGHLRATELQDLAGAIDALSRAESEAPEDLAVLHELATFSLERAGQRGDGPAAAQERARAADLFVRLARGVPPDHALAYTQSALDAAPAHEEALTLLESLAAEHDREDLLPLRWVGYLQWAPEGAGADHRRRRLGRAYVDAGQIDDALVCLEPLANAGDAEAAETLVPIYRARGRGADAGRALAVAVAGLPPEARAPRLRELVETLRDAGQHEEAFERAKELLALEPNDLDTLGFVEDELRRREDHRELRDLLLGATRMPGAPIDVTKRRLREVAELDEDRLGDADGAVAAYGALLSLDPADEEARRRLGELLERLERWDALVAHLERESLGVVDPDAKASLLMRLALLHRDRREDPVAARAALRNLRQLRPDDGEARDALCELLLEMESWAEALPLLEERIEIASGDERLRLLELLGTTLEERIGDDQAAFAASTRLLDEEPASLVALDRMERIDLRAANAGRLLETLAYRVEVVPNEERASILVRVAQIADGELGDLDRAADALQQALDLDPTSGEVLDTLCDVYDRGGRYKDLVVLLRERARLEEQAVARAELYRRIARILGDRVGNLDAAAEAWEKVLEAGDDEEALRALLQRAIDNGQAEARLHLAGRLANVVEGDERRDLHVQRARWLEAEERLDEAVVVVREAVLPVAPTHLPALFDLARWEERRGDDAGLADALSRQLDLLEDEGLRLPVASRLADLYEGPLADDERAVEALHAWIDCDLMDATPRERLVAKLEANARWPELLDALDGLAGVEVDDEVRGDLIRRAATVASERLSDVDGAWERLAPRVAEDAEAETQIRALAEAHGRHEPLAELFVRAAQTASTPADQRRRWLDAAQVLEGPVGDPSRALEAVLRAYALDLADEGLLGEVDRLAAASHAWARLAQVYETLLRSVETPRAKKKLLVRHAKLLDTVGDDPGGALDRALRACALDADDDALLGYVEDLAPRAGRAEELLVVYDRRRSAATTDEARADALLRAAHLCDVDLRDRDRAFTYVAQTVALSVRTPAVVPHLERAVAELDELASSEDARRRLVAVYRALAEDAEHDPRGAASLLLRAARLLEDDLASPDEAFACLEKASQDAPIPEVLDALESAAERHRRFDALDARLALLIADALDSRTAADLLRRRGRVLEERLGRLDEAADVYRQLLVVARDEATADRLLACLRKARRHQDLLGAIDQELARARDKDRRLTLLREAATVWEKDLGNKWEAQDAWKKVLAASPDDAVATEALQRLGASTRRLHPDDIAPAPSEVPDDPSTVQASLEEFEDATPVSDEPESIDGGDVEALEPASSFEEDTPSLEDAVPPFASASASPGTEGELPFTSPADAPHDFADMPSTAAEVEEDEPLFADEAPSSEHLALFEDDSTGGGLFDAPPPLPSTAADSDPLVVSPPARPNPFGRREGTMPLMNGFAEEIHTHVEADASLDDEFPPLPGVPSVGTLDDALPYAATVAANLDVDDEDDVDSVPVRDESPLGVAEDEVEDLGTGELLAYEDANSAELFALDGDDVLEDDEVEDLDDELVDLLEEEAAPKVSLPPPPPPRRED